MYLTLFEHFERFGAFQEKMRFISHSKLFQKKNNQTIREL